MFTQDLIVSSSDLAAAPEPAVLEVEELPDGSILVQPDNRGKHHQQAFILLARASYMHIQLY